MPSADEVLLLKGTRGGEWECPTVAVPVPGLQFVVQNSRMKVICHEKVAF